MADAVIVICFRIAINKPDQWVRIQGGAGGIEVELFCAGFIEFDKYKIADYLI
jgi:hypothetical protein